MAEYTGKGDAARTLELLWGVQREGRRGPRQRLEVRDIASAAIALADAEGLAAVTMRRVAEALGVAPMSLYTYVPSKDVLVDVMVDTVCFEVAGDDLEGYARSLCDMYVRHPWALGVAPARGTLGPGSTTSYETAMRAAGRLPGLSWRERAAAVTTVDAFVRGAAAHIAGGAASAAATGQTDAEWWAAREPILDQLFDGSRFPTLVEASANGAFDPAEGADHATYDLDRAREDFEFGLARLLAGLRGRAR